MHTHKAQDSQGTHKHTHLTKSPVTLWNHSEKCPFPPEHQSDHVTLPAVLAKLVSGHWPPRPHTPTAQLIYYWSWHNCREGIIHQYQLNSQYKRLLNNSGTRCPPHAGKQGISHTVRSWSLRRRRACVYTICVLCLHNCVWRVSWSCGNIQSQPSSLGNVSPGEVTELWPPALLLHHHCLKPPSLIKCVCVRVWVCI